MLSLGGGKLCSALKILSLLSMSLSDEREVTMEKEREKVGQEREVSIYHGNQVKIAGRGSWRRWRTKKLSSRSSSLIWVLIVTDGD